MKGLGVALNVYVVGDDGLADAEGRFPGSFGISPSGAVLVRPDGFVGWRAVNAAGAPEDALRQALQTLQAVRGQLQGRTAGCRALPPCRLARKSSSRA